MFRSGFVLFEQSRGIRSIQNGHARVRTRPQCSVTVRYIANQDTGIIHSSFSVRGPLMANRRKEIKIIKPAHAQADPVSPDSTAI